MRVAKLFLSLLKSIYFNYKVFPFRIAVKLPMILAYNTKLFELHSGTVKFEGPITFGMVRYGWAPGSNGIPSGVSKWSVDKNCMVVFKGRANFASGVSIRCDNGGIIIFETSFTCNSNCFFASNSSIEIGDDVLIGWNTNIRDVDGHSIIELDEWGDRIVTNSPKKVSIGNNVWIAAYVDILKGVIIPDNCVVAYRACVTGQFQEEHCILGGFPAKIIKRNILWER